MTFRISSFVLAGVLALTGVGFGTDASAQRHRDQYDSRYDQRREICNYCGTVRNVSRINRNSRKTGATVLGAIIGGAIGNQVGGGSGRKAATVAGAVAGGVIANKNTRDDRRRTFYRISVRMDNGRVYNFDQSSAQGLRAGTRVEVQDGTVYRAR